MTAALSTLAEARRTWPAAPSGLDGLAGEDAAAVQESRNRCPPRGSGSR